MSTPIEADYVIIGAGAAGMAFADALVRHSTATVAIIDRELRPGGHWNHAYPFISLHLPSHYYGVDSTPLGDTSRVLGSLNDGLLHMASGTEVLDYFGRVMRQVLLASGRVAYFPMTDYGADVTARSRLTGERRQVVARKKLVDASFSDTQVPATHHRSFAVATGVSCIPISELARVTQPPER